MPAIVLKLENADGTPGDLAANAWVYWKVGGTATVLRSRADGQLVGLKSGEPPTRAGSYSDPFSAAEGTVVKLHHSRGNKPIPAGRLDENDDAFVSRTVPKGSANGASVVVDVAPNQPNTLKASAVSIAVLAVPPPRLALETPKELEVWPVLWDPLAPTFSTAGLTQGAALWTNGQVQEGGAPTAVPASVRPKERGLVFKGKVEGGATGVEVQIVDKSGAVVPLRANATSTADVQWLPAGLEGGAFTARVWFARPADAFGANQLLVRSTGGATPRILGGFAGWIMGAQGALCVDTDDGQSGKAPPGEAEEVVVVDFKTSPRSTRELMQAETRSRRMVRYYIGLRTRTTTDHPAQNILRPEMPMWMVELHLVGLTKDDLEDLFLRRREAVPGAVPSLNVEASWTLHLAWDGPDIGTGSDRLYQYSADFKAALSAVIEFDVDKKTVKNLGADNRIAGALTPAPTRIDYPVPNRRLPIVAIGKERRWGRSASGISKPALLVEWQPRIEVENREVMRGGNGRLILETLKIDGTRVAPGVRNDGSNEAAPDAALPEFRVPGKNPPPPSGHTVSAAVAALVDGLVDDFVKEHATDAYVAALPLVAWQGTIRRMLGHEAGVQFDGRGTKIRKFKADFHGYQGELPIFGPPHGYGFGQHDSPPVNDDGAWSFLENIRESIRRLIQDKGSGAYNALKGHFSTPMTKRDRAVYRRELVRRYNGSTEFKWNATTNVYEISPGLAKWEDAADHSKGANARLTYPNNVLGTGVAYSSGAGASTTFSWPITFAETEFGPDL